MRMPRGLAEMTSDLGVRGSKRCLSPEHLVSALSCMRWQMNCVTWHDLAPNPASNANGTLTTSHGR